MSHHIEKWARTLSLVGILIFTGVIVSQLQVAFGWTNPLQNPPGGSGALSVVNGMVGVNTSNPSTAQLVINAQGGVPAIDAGGSGTLTDIIGLPAVPSGATAAASKAYVDAQAGGGGGSGGGSMVLYYRTISSIPSTPPTCPSGWTPQYTGYGPHYLGLFVHDWQQSGVAGSGGFATGFTPPTPNGNNGYTYILRSAAIGSDSTCSQDQQSVVYFSNLYNNQLTNGFTSMRADACFTDTSVTPNVTECNRCLVCQK